MQKILLWIKKNLSLLIALTVPMAVFIGYIFPLGFLKNYTSLILFFMIYPMMININFGDLKNALTNIKPILISLIINFTFIPLLALIIGKIFFYSDPMLLTGLMLIGLIPTSGMTASWTGLAGGKVQTSLVLMIINLLASIIMIPLYMTLLLGEVIDVPTTAIIMTLVKVVILPMILGYITRLIVIKYQSADYLNTLKPTLGGISSLGVIAIVLVAISLKSKVILNDLSLVGYIIIPLVLFYLASMFLSKWVASHMVSQPEQIPLVYSTTLRNLTIALGISLSSFGESTAVLLIAIAYIVQLPLASHYMKSISKVKFTPLTENA